MDRISPQGARSCNPASSYLGSREPWRREPSSGEAPPCPARPSQPRPWKLLPPFSQLAANASGATDQVTPQNCSEEGRASSLSLAQLLPGSPSPLKSAQRRLLLAICCQWLEKPNINTAANAHPSFLPPPPQIWALSPLLLPFILTHLSFGSRQWVFLEGWVAGGRLSCRGSQPTGGNVPLGMLGSLRSLGNRGLGTDRTHNIPGSRSSGVIQLLFLCNSKCVRGITARGIKKRLNIFILKLKEPM